MRWCAAALAGLLSLAGCGERRSANSGSGAAPGSDRGVASAEPAREVRGEPIKAVAHRPSQPPADPAAAVGAPTPRPGSETATLSTTPPSPLVNPGAGSPVTSGSAAPAGVGELPYPLVGFERLSGYPIEISDELLGPVTNNQAEVSRRTEALIPATVKAYSQKQVTLRGFMLPLKVEGGLVTELLIMKDQSMCCYGAVPKIHEWVSVKMSGKGVKPVMDQPVTLQGKLHVGEMRENGYLTGIYRLEGERMAEVPAP